MISVEDMSLSGSEQYFTIETKGSKTKRTLLNAYKSNNDVYAN